MYRALLLQPVHCFWSQRDGQREFGVAILGQSRPLTVNQSSPRLHVFPRRGSSVSTTGTSVLHRTQTQRTRLATRVWRCNGRRHAHPVPASVPIQYQRGRERFSTSWGSRRRDSVHLRRSTVFAEGRYADADQAERVGPFHPWLVCWSARHIRACIVRNKWMYA